MRRIHGDDVLKHPRRQAILAALRIRPGLSLRGIKQAVGLEMGTTRFHVSLLLRGHAIWEDRLGNRHTYYPGPKPNGQGVLALRARHQVTSHQATSLSYLAANPWTCQKAVLDAVEGPATPRSTVQHGLCVLERLGLVETRLAGRRKLYHVTYSTAAVPMEAHGSLASGELEAWA